jgi:ferredoxin
MADRTRKIPRGQKGKWYVDENCIACGLCADVAPDNMQVDWEQGHAFVKKQPAAKAETKRMAEAAEECPVEAIGNDA